MITELSPPVGTETSVPVSFQHIVTLLHSDRLVSGLRFILSNVADFKGILARDRPASRVNGKRRRTENGGLLRQQA